MLLKMHLAVISIVFSLSAQAVASEGCELRIPLTETGFKVLYENWFQSDHTPSVRSDIGVDAFGAGRLMLGALSLPWKIRFKNTESIERSFEVSHIVKKESFIGTGSIPVQLTTTHSWAETRGDVVDQMLTDAFSFLSFFTNGSDAWSALQMFHRNLEWFGFPEKQFLVNDLAESGVVQPLWVVSQSSEKYRWKKMVRLFENGSSLKVLIGRSVYWPNTQWQYENHELEAEPDDSSLCETSGADLVEHLIEKLQSKGFTMEHVDRSVRPHPGQPVEDYLNLRH